MGLLLLVTVYNAITILLAAHTGRTNGQQVAVSLRLKNNPMPNNTLIWSGDIYETATNYVVLPTNTNLQQHDNTLSCQTNLVECCESQGLGNWYYPDGRKVEMYSSNTNRASYLSNRGQKERSAGRNLTGSVRLFRLGMPVQQGRFRCEIPDADNVTRTLYAFIVNIVQRDRFPITISASHSTSIAGDTGYSLVCSITVSNSVSIPFAIVLNQWFKGSNAFPPGVTPMPTTSSRNSYSTTYSSVLQFSPLSQHLHTGMYRCRMGAVSLARDTVVTVTAPDFSARITTSSAEVLKEYGYSLTCVVDGAENLNASISYQWTKNTRAQREILVGYRTSPILSFSPLRWSDTGIYTCKATINSDYILNAVTVSSPPFEVSFQRILEPTVSLHSNLLSPIVSGSTVSLICIMEIKPKPFSVTNDTKVVLSRPDGTVFGSMTAFEMKHLALYEFSNTLKSVKPADSGVYSCKVSIEGQVEFSASINVTIVDGLFQLRLKSVGICQQWHSDSSDKSKLYRKFINGALIKTIKHHCQCHFPLTNLLNEDLFICEDSRDQMTYRNALLGTNKINGTQVIGFIQEWVSTGPLMKIAIGNSARVDSSCPVAISSLDEPGCA